MVDFDRISNRRLNDRQTVSFKTSIKVGKLATSCEVRDISTGGARIKASIGVQLNSQIIIVIGQLGNFSGQVAWVNSANFGIRFDEPAERIALAIKLMNTFGRH